MLPNEGILGLSLQLALSLLDFLGVFVFALSGGVLAARKDMDLFGFVVMALLPAVGGGTLRDLVLDVPVFWLADPRYLYITLLAALLSFSLHRQLLRSGGLRRWFDAVGLSVFCVLGTQKALAITGDTTIAVVMGVISAVAGGILRDTIANDLPLILRREIYATAAFVGALVFVLLASVNLTAATLLGATAALGLRALGIVRGLELPRAGGSTGEP